MKKTGGKEVKEKVIVNERKERLRLLPPNCKENLSC